MNARRGGKGLSMVLWKFEWRCGTSALELCATVP